MELVKSGGAVAAATVCLSGPVCLAQQSVRAAAGSGRHSRRATEDGFRRLSTLIGTARRQGQHGASPTCFFMTVQRGSYLLVHQHARSSGTANLDSSGPEQSQYGNRMCQEPDIGPSIRVDSM